MTINRTFSKSIYSVFLYVILFLSTCCAVFSIISYQAYSSFLWNQLVVYFRLLLVIVDFLYLLIAISARRRIEYRVFILFLVMLYFLMLSLIIYYPSLLQLISDGFAWPLTYIVYYMYLRERDFPNGFSKAIVLCYLACVACIIRTLQTVYLGSNQGQVYYVISYMPLILLLCNKKTKIVTSILSCLLVLISAKRAGIIVLVLGFSALFMFSAFQEPTFKKRVKRIAQIILISIIVFIAASYYIQVTNSNIIQRFNNISVDQGSGRVALWENVIKNYQQSTMTNKIFGHGFHAVQNQLRPFGKLIFAHDSYLEYLYDFGIIGLCLLVTIVIGLIGFAYKIVKEKNYTAPYALFALSAILVFSTISYCFETSTTIIMLASFWGAIQGMYFRERSEEINP